MRDLQHFAIERLRAENQALRIERDALKGSQDRGARLGEGVRRFVLDLIDARSFAEVIARGDRRGARFRRRQGGVLRRKRDGIAATGSEGVRLIAPGTVTAVVGPGGMGAILSGGGEILFGRAGPHTEAWRRSACASAALAARFTCWAPLAEGRFEGRESEADLGYFARATGTGDPRMARSAESLKQDWLDGAGP